MACNSLTAQLTSTLDLSGKLIDDAEVSVRSSKYGAAKIGKMVEGLTLSIPKFSRLATNKSEYRTEPATSRLSFGKVIGCQAAKQALFENVVFPLKSQAAVFTGIRNGCGNVLLHGPPGTGKTLLAQAAAEEAGAKLFSIRPSDMLSKYQGESERHIRGIFDAARACGKAMIFFDEFDSVAASRGGSDDGIQARRLLSELLLQLTHNKQLQTQSEPEQQQDEQVSKRARVDSSQGDGAAARVVVVAATNRIEDLDEAVLRRFECKVYVGAPDQETRQAMVLHYLRGVDHTLTHEELGQVGTITFGWSGSDIESLCREAAMVGVREVLSYHEGMLPDLEKIRPVCLKDFEVAQSQMLLKEEAAD